MSSRGLIRSGIGGWTFAPWDAAFYPPKLPKARQLDFAAEKLATIEINGTYYRGQKPETFARWAASTPEGFIFSVKGNRFVTNRKILAEAAESMQKFFATGISELGDRLGPILWQFAPTKKFDPDDFGAFLDLLPKETNGVGLRHVVEVRHDSFCVPEFPSLLRGRGVGVVFADHASYPAIADLTADFVYVRLQRGSDEEATCYPSADLDRWAERSKTWAAGGMPRDLPLADSGHVPDNRPRDVFVYFIHEGKVRAPHGAMEFSRRTG